MNWCMQSVLGSCRRRTTEEVYGVLASVSVPVSVMSGSRRMYSVPLSSTVAFRSEEFLYDSAV